ncbi:MAG: hypothetical protein ACREEM_41940, partial [Blastocatellia bacterium]
MRRIRRRRFGHIRTPPIEDRFVAADRNLQPDFVLEAFVLIIKLQLFADIVRADTNDWVVPRVIGFIAVEDFASDQIFVQLRSLALGIKIVQQSQEFLLFRGMGKMLAVQDAAQRQAHILRTDRRFDWMINLTFCVESRRHWISLKNGQKTLVQYGERKRPELSGMGHSSRLRS